MKKLAILVLAFALMILPMAAMAIALPEPQNGVITLTDDITLDTAPNFSGNVKLTASAPVTITTNLTDVFTANAGVTLTLGKNITVNSSSSILYANGGKIIVDGAVLNTSSASSYGLAYAEKNGTIDLKSGALNGQNASTTVFMEGGSTLNVSGGSITASNATAVTASGNAKVNINGGFVTTTHQEKVAVYAKNGGKIVMTDGTVKANGDAISPETGCSADISGGNVISLSNEGVDVHKDAKMTITGGYIEGKKAAVNVHDGGSLVVSSGSFSDDTAWEYLKEGLTLVTKNGKFVVTTPAAAVEGVSMPSTGDSSSLMLWSALMVLACAGFVASRKLRCE